MNIDGTVIVVADLGHMKAYKAVAKSGVDPHDTMQVSHVNHHTNEKQSIVLEQIFNVDYIDARKRVSEEMSDKPGRFDISTGESHNMLLEKDLKGLKQIAQDIDKVIADEAPNAWFLAFPKDTNCKLIGLLGADTLKVLDKNLHHDLTKIDKNDLLAHFEA